MPYKDPNKQREYQRKRTSLKRLQYIAELGGKCKWCNSTDNLQFDHIKPELKTSHRIWSWSDERIRKELDKCQLLCHSCHVEKTWSGLRQTNHGTAAMYKRCKCEKCREWMRQNKRNWRIKNQRH